MTHVLSRMEKPTEASMFVFDATISVILFITETTFS